jgi:hypothetical protein
MKNPKFSALLKRMELIHDKKNSDYADGIDPYSNFTYAAKVSEIFTNPIDRVFAVLIGIKLARIAELGKGKDPRNESLDDSFLDIATYTAIWASYMIGQPRLQYLEDRVYW